MANSQKRSPTRAGRRFGGYPGAKRWPGSRSGRNPEQHSTSSRSLWQGFPLGDSELAERIRVLDWTLTGIGPISNWSQPVRSAIAICADMALPQQKKLVRLEEALREAREELARVTRITAVGQLWASIAHEISQPLLAIVSNSDACLHWLASHEPDLEKARVTAQRMARDAKRASDIIARIRSLMNKTVSERVLLDVNSLIRDVLYLMQFELQKREVSVQTELATSLPMILGDRVQLRQVILNLVLNSMEAMMPVQDRPKTLHVKSQLHETNDIGVSVYDTGVGLDLASADRVFEPFFTTKSKGTGMGLSICRSILEAHHGRISALPRVPHGAIFRFSLPSGE